MYILIITGLVVALLLLHQKWWKRWNLVNRKLVDCQRELGQSKTHSDDILSQEQAQQVALLNSMIEGVLVLDGDGRIRWSNRSLEKTFQVKSNIQGRTLM